MTQPPADKSADPPGPPADESADPSGPAAGGARSEGPAATAAPAPQPGAGAELERAGGADPAARPGEVAAPTAASPSAAATPSEPAPSPAGVPPPDLARTRAAAAWFATGAGLVVLVLLIILILQNQDVVQVRYLWFSGSIPLGAALLIAAIAGAAVVMLVGIVRLTQLRLHSRRARRAARRHGSA